MSYDRKCELCRRGFYSNGKPLEICWSFALKTWCCLYCYLNKVYR
jgi:hypothetical protein